MPNVNRDLLAAVKIVTSCITAAFIVFFISALAGEDLFKNHKTIAELDVILVQISNELEVGIEQRIKQLGEIPSKNPYKKFYCSEFAKEIHEISYITEKQKILFDGFNVREFEGKSKRLVSYSERGDLNSLLNELEIVKRELKNSANLVDKNRKKLVRQRMAYIILFFVFWIAVFFYYGRGFIKT